MRQSTTQKITRRTRYELLWLCPAACGLTSKECGSDGFIARHKGQEFAVVDVFLNHFLPCPIEHPSTPWLPIAECTIRKFLIPSQVEVDNVLIGEACLAVANELTGIICQIEDKDYGGANNRYQEGPKAAIVEDMVNELIDEGNRLKFEIGNYKKYLIA